MANETVGYQIIKPLGTGPPASGAPLECPSGDSLKNSEIPPNSVRDGSI
jgi:hypothetical protein